MTFGEVKRLHKWAKAEQELLWYDLLDDLRHAVAGGWSIGAADTAGRIVGVARLIGPTPFRKVPWDLLAGGVYAAVLAVGGVPAEMPNAEQWQEYEDVMYPTYGAKHSDLTQQYRETVRHLSSEQEAAYIRNRADDV